MPNSKMKTTELFYIHVKIGDHEYSKIFSTSIEQFVVGIKHYKTTVYDLTLNTNIFYFDHLLFN